MSDYKFTKDWFHWAPKVWTHLHPLMPNKTKFLEIGSYEGRSAVWLLEHMVEEGGELFCVDTWEGGEEHVNDDMKGAEDRFHHNINIAKQKFPNRAVFTFRSTSVEALAAMHATKTSKFDFIYIDGSHIAKDVLTDACMSWPLLKKDGVMVFDDYLWGDMSRPNHVPKSAIDAFVNIFIEELNVIHLGYQFIVRKTK